MISLIFHFITYQILSHIYSNRGHTPRRQQPARSSRGLPTVIFQRSNADEPIRMQASDHRTTRQLDPGSSIVLLRTFFRVLFPGGSFQPKKTCLRGRRSVCHPRTHTGVRNSADAGRTAPVNDSYWPANRPQPSASSFR